MLTTGSKLGPYEIVVPIGAGGMGEVYRARDSRLDRDVALKVLTAAAALDADRLRRFEQEARATAALNHPNILAVFDVGAAGSVNYVVSELLEGETLRDRLKIGPLPIRKAIEVGAQIARGLAAAHDKGIVHRDLKPENLFVTRDGRVKILDFGIAKLIGPRGGQTIAPTIERGTTPGVVLGTVGYMSPEQVRGLDTDHRTDIFSLGAILFEMITGRRAFSGATEADTMSAILTADPPESDALRAAPPLVDRIVRRCLEKSPDERFQSARDLAFDLDALSTASHSSGSTAIVDAPPPARSRMSAARVGGALAAGIALGAAAVWMLTVPGRRASTPAAFHQLTFRRGTLTHARFSPDGQTIVYSAGWEGHDQELYSTRVGAIGERALGIDGELLAVSKAGEIALLRGARRISNWMETGTLARVPLGGGAPREILRDIGGADWSPDGEQLAVTRFLPANRHWRLEYPVGTVVLDTDRWIEQPRVSRDGTRILLLDHPISGDNRGRVIQITLAGQRTELTPEYPSITSVMWSPSGDEAWFSGSTGGMRLELLAASPGRAVRPVTPMPASIIIEDALPNGRLLMQTQSLKARVLVKTPADTEERDSSWFDYALLRDMSADGSMILFDEEGEGGGPKYSVFVRRTDGSPAIRLTDGYAGKLSPDLQWATVGGPDDPPNVFSIVPIGAGEMRKVTLSLESGGGTNVRWFPDGKRLVMVGNEKGHRRRTYEYTIDGGKIRALTPEDVTGSLVSPDGRTLIVTATGKTMLWPLEGGEPRAVPGVPPGLVLRWAADGHSVFVGTQPTPRTWTIERIDLSDGRRQSIVTVGPSDAAGVTNVSVPLVSADGRTYAYRYNQLLSDLFVGDGIR